MRTILASMVLMAAVVLLAGGIDAGEKAKKEGKEVVLKGTITCGKCDLKQDKACATVIVVKKDTKETVYYFDPAGHKKHHSVVCTESKEGSVTGTVKTEGEKKIITVKEVKFKD